MTGELLERLWAARLEGLRRIESQAGDFKECDQCRSILPRTYGLCPWCRSYRFKEDVETVRATLAVMAARPWPLNAGVVPRITWEAPVQPKPAPGTSPLPAQAGQV